MESPYFVLALSLVTDTHRARHLISDSVQRWRGSGFFFPVGMLTGLASNELMREKKKRETERQLTTVVACGVDG